MACRTPPVEKEKIIIDAISHHQSHPIPKIYITHYPLHYLRGHHPLTTYWASNWTAWIEIVARTLSYTAEWFIAMEICL